MAVSLHDVHKVPGLESRPYFCLASRKEYFPWASSVSLLYEEIWVCYRCCLFEYPCLNAERWKMAGYHWRSWFEYHYDEGLSTSIIVQTFGLPPRGNSCQYRSRAQNPLQSGRLQRGQAGIWPFLRFVLQRHSDRHQTENKTKCLHITIFVLNNATHFLHRYIS